ncbi:MAG: amidohydrolase family protein, partial [Caulobacteraceae bacterium]
EETARFVAERGAYVVPTMATIFALKELGAKLGFPASSQAKMEIAHAAALEGLEIMKTAGVKLGYGTDLLGETYVQECREFELRREVFSPLEILRQATSSGAEILMQEGKLGCIAPEAHADLILVEGDPLSDIGLLAANGETLALVMRAGEIVKERLAA